MNANELSSSSTSKEQNEQEMSSASSQGEERQNNMISSNVNSKNLIQLQENKSEQEKTDKMSGEYQYTHLNFPNNLAFNFTKNQNINSRNFKSPYMPPSTYSSQYRNKRYMRPVYSQELKSQDNTDMSNSDSTYSYLQEKKHE